MKKLIALLLAVVMLLAFAACGGEAEKPADDEKAPATDTETVAVGAVIIARDDIPSDEIYAMVSTIFENTDALAEQHGKGKELDLDFAASMTSVPYHPGAAKYFKEKGVEVSVG